MMETAKVAIINTTTFAPLLTRGFRTSRYIRTATPPPVTNAKGRVSYELGNPPKMKAVAPVNIAITTKFEWAKLGTFVVM
jgi:hypothetical protein